MSGFATEMEVGNWDMEVVAQKKTSKEGKPSVHGINGRKGEVVAHKRGRPREVLLYYCQHSLFSARVAFSDLAQT